MARGWQCSRLCCFGGQRLSQFSWISEKWVHLCETTISLNKISVYTFRNEYLYWCVPLLIAAIPAGKVIGVYAFGTAGIGNRTSDGDYIRYIESAIKSLGGVAITSADIGDSYAFLVRKGRETTNVRNLSSTDDKLMVILVIPCHKNKYNHIFSSWKEINAFSIPCVDDFCHHLASRWGIHVCALPQRDKNIIIIAGDITSATESRVPSGQVGSGQYIHLTDWNRELDFQVRSS